MIPKRFVSLAFVMLFAGISVYATHFRSAHISYRKTAHLTYLITLTTYTTNGAPSPPDKDTMEINMGDGNLFRIPRINGPGGSGEICGSNTKKNIFQAQYTYNGEGWYVVSLFEQNRINGIVNIGGSGSVNVPLYVETLIPAFSNPPFCNNSSVTIDQPCSIDYSTGDTLVANLAASDSDGDSLVFKLITPLQNVNTPVPGYQLPDEINPLSGNSFSIDANSGVITWAKPAQIGPYSVAVKISEYKNGQFYGSSIADFMIFIDDESYDITSGGNQTVFNVSPGDTLKYTVNTFCAVGQDVSLALIDAFNPTGNYMFNETTTSTTAQGEFEWIIEAADSRIAPYYITFRSIVEVPVANNTLIKSYLQDHTIQVNVSGGTASNCAGLPAAPVGILELESLMELSVYPNPAIDRITMELPDELVGQQGLSVQLIDLRGQAVIPDLGLGVEQITSFDVSFLDDAIYFLVLSQDGAIIGREMILMRR